MIVSMGVKTPNFDYNAFDGSSITIMKRIELLLMIGSSKAQQVCRN